LIKASVAHNLDGSLARGVGCHGGDGFQAQGADLGVDQGVRLGLLGLCCGCNVGERREQIVGCEPVVIGELEAS
jgi:hypothetical protein